MEKLIQLVLKENKHIFESLHRYYLKVCDNSYDLYLKGDDGDMFTLFEDQEEEKIVINQLLKTDIEIRK